jgi:hypothetical protein
MLMEGASGLVQTAFEETDMSDYRKRAFAVTKFLSLRELKQI